MGFFGQSGTPRTELAAHPVYTNAEEVPIAARGSLGRTPWSATLDLHADYAFKLAMFKERPLRLVADPRGRGVLWARFPPRRGSVLQLFRHPWLKAGTGAPASPEAHP